MIATYIHASGMLYVAWLTGMDNQGFTLSLDSDTQILVLSMNSLVSVCELLYYYLTNHHSGVHPH